MARRSATIVLLAAAAACSKSTTGPSNDPTATTLQLVAGDAQTALIGTRLPAPLVVKVLDQFNNPMAGVGVSFNGNLGGNASAPVPTDAAGITQATFTLGTIAGTVTINVTAGVVAIAAKFTATALAGPPAGLRKLAGDGQVAAVGSTLTHPFVIDVKDSHGNNLRGVQVTWTTTATGTLNPSSGTTDATGIAQTTYTLSTTAGVQSITAHVAGLADVTFLATGS